MKTAANIVYTIMLPIGRTTHILTVGAHAKKDNGQIDNDE